MSAPTPAPGDESPREGYYPDPSIPGYVRYWNGATWVPGTSRPAPGPGETLSPPPGVAPAPAPPPHMPPPAAEETGPLFLDGQDPGPAPQPQDPAPAQQSAEQPPVGQPADASGAQEPAAPWSARPGADPRQPGAPAPAPVHAGEPEGTVTIRRVPAEAAEPAGPPVSDGTVTIRRVGEEPPGARRPTAGAGDEPATDGTVTFRRPGPGGAGADSADDGTMTIRTGRGGPPAAPPGGGDQAAPPGDNRIPQQSAGQFGAPAAPQIPGQSGPGAAPPAGYGYPVATTAAQPPAGPAAPGYGYPAGPPQGGQAPAGYGYPAPPQGGGPPASGGYGYPGGSASGAPGGYGYPAGHGGAVPQQGGGGWAGDVRRLAQPGADEPVVPWKPPVVDPFQAAAQAQAAARPAGLGRRFAARLIDTVVVGAVTTAAAVPLYTRGSDHVHGKIDTAKLTGRTVKVWVLDGTTGGYLAAVLAVLVVVGVLYEVLPTAKWGRTLGKRLLGLGVRDIEGYEPPSLGGALRRWLVLWVPSLLVVGLLGLLWCVVDRPWRQCWHDKAAGTFVAGS
ncbi:RDD family protein [Streptomyces sp. NPDC050560]|uniref:RDD family protein n=1 Tax=Streptomyces sp. NPDC050560 TaxID=3365630 RepID=UPI0037B12E1F